MNKIPDGFISNEAKRHDYIESFSMRVASFGFATWHCIKAVYKITAILIIVFMCGCLIYGFFHEAINQINTNSDKIINAAFICAAALILFCFIPYIFTAVFYIIVIAIAGWLIAVGIYWAVVYFDLTITLDTYHALRTIITFGGNL